MKTKIGLLFVALVITIQGYAQHSSGLVLDNKKFNTLPAYPELGRGMKQLDNTPIEKDLSMYLPPICDQGKAHSCVAWATVYNAYSIMVALRDNITDPLTISLSAMLPYKQLRPNCDSGLDLPDIALYVKARGSVPYSDYSTSLCESTPSSALLRKATTIRPIKEVLSVFNSESTNSQKISKTKQQIGTLNTPVIVGIQITDKFQRHNSSDDFYRPEGNLIGFHAVVVVGYDYRGFKIVNTWGSQWGNNGFFNISFEDFAQISQAGMVLSLSENDNNQRLSQSTSISGQFDFTYQTTNGTFRTFSPQHMGNGVYETPGKVWKVGQLFQLITNNPTKQQYMCVFSIDNNNKITTHWPRNTKIGGNYAAQYGMPESDFLPLKNFDIVIPSKDEALNIQTAGTDYLCVFFSNEPLLDDMNNIFSSIKRSNGTIYSRIRSALGNRLVNSNDITYSPSEMGGVAQTSQGNIVPLILKITSED